MCNEIVAHAGIVQRRHIGKGTTHRNNSSVLSDYLILCEILLCAVKFLKIKEVLC